MKVESKLPENDFLLVKAISEPSQTYTCEDGDLGLLGILLEDRLVGKSCLRIGSQDKLTFQVFHIDSFLLRASILPLSFVMQLSLANIPRFSTEHPEIGHCTILIVVQ